MAVRKYWVDYLCASAGSLWSAFSITDTLIVVAIVFLFILNWFSPIFPEHPTSWLIAALVLVLAIGKVERTQYQLYSDERSKRELLEQQRIPLLTPEQPHVAASKAGSIPVVYVRFKVRNTSSKTATRCSAKLVRIEFLDATGWRDLAYHDTLDMTWANKFPPGSGREVDLAPDGVDILDVVNAAQGHQELFLATIVRANYPGLMRPPGHYQFTIKLVCAESGNRTVRLRVHWGSSLDTLGFPGDPLDFE